MRKKILFLSWKDVTHPSAGGAEILTDVLARHLATTNDVTYVTSWYAGALHHENVHGYHVIRKGSVRTTYFHTFVWWLREGRKMKLDYIIDQAHGIPFFSILYPNHPTILCLVMEVAGPLWNHVYPVVLRWVAKALELVWLRLYRRSRIVTISESTKSELLEHGVHNVSLIPMFTRHSHPSVSPRPEIPTLLVVGRIAPMKRIEDAIEAYIIAKRSIPSLRLIIIGKSEEAYSEYAQHIATQAQQDANITLIRDASDSTIQEWMQRSHLLLMTSKKEGYGLVILEAGIFGVPTIGYRVQGIQDAIQDTVTGILVPDANPSALAHAVISTLHNTPLYTRLRQAAFAWASLHTKERTAHAFEEMLRSQP